MVLPSKSPCSPYIDQQKSQQQQQQQQQRATLLVEAMVQLEQLSKQVVAIQLLITHCLEEHNKDPKKQPKPATDDPLLCDHPSFSTTTCSSTSSCGSDKQKDLENNLSTMAENKGDRHRGVTLQDDDDDDTIVEEEGSTTAALSTPDDTSESLSSSPSYNSPDHFNGKVMVCSTSIKDDQKPIVKRHHHEPQSTAASSSLPTRTRTVVKKSNYCSSTHGGGGGRLMGSRTTKTSGGTLRQLFGSTTKRQQPRCNNEQDDTTTTATTSTTSSRSFTFSRGLQRSHSLKLPPTTPRSLSPTREFVRLASAASQRTASVASQAGKRTASVASQAGMLTASVASQAGKRTASVASQAGKRTASVASQAGMLLMKPVQVVGHHHHNSFSSSSSIPHAQPPNSCASMRTSTTLNIFCSPIVSQEFIMERLQELQDNPKLVHLELEDCLANYEQRPQLMKEIPKRLQEIWSLQDRKWKGITMVDELMDGWEYPSFQFCRERFLSDLLGTTGTCCKVSFQTRIHLTDTEKDGSSRRIMQQDELMGLNNNDNPTSFEEGGFAAALIGMIQDFQKDPGIIRLNLSTMERSADLVFALIDLVECDKREWEDFVVEFGEDDSDEEDIRCWPPDLLDAAEELQSACKKRKLLGLVGHSKTRLNDHVEATTQQQRNSTGSNNNKYHNNNAARRTSNSLGLFRAFQFEESSRGFESLSDSSRISSTGFSI